MREWESQEGPALVAGKGGVPGKGILDPRGQWAGMGLATVAVTQDPTCGSFLLDPGTLEGHSTRGLAHPGSPTGSVLSVAPPPARATAGHVQSEGSQSSPLAKGMPQPREAGAAPSHWEREKAWGMGYGTCLLTEESSVFLVLFKKTSMSFKSVPEDVTV